jgi:para-aminobenzoate synthetase/4-amino-4-deoxychorismate lyase
MPDLARPFALFPCAATGGARLFDRPVGCIAAGDAAEVGPALTRLAEAGRAGLWAAGGLAYEAGLALEPRLLPLAAETGDAAPRLWFGLFERAQPLAPEALAALFDSAGPARIGEPAPAVAEAAHAAAVAHAKALIAAGDIYQVNLTFPVDVPVAGHPVAIFARLWRDGRPPHAALVFTGARWWLSLSPELFFTCAAGQLTTRPMKGTAARAKNRAENLMIVDLLRNDLARVAVPGSVAVPSLFAVETYPSIHQMTSTVTARLAPGRTAIDALAALFPCGSITGAPKIRAMEVIAALEPAPRGIYCGSIGWIAPGGRDAAFNVAIRTLDLAPGAATARLGLGSGIVADSVADGEWAESLEKGRFLGPSRPASLLETMRRDAGGQVPLLDRHLDRLAASAARFGFACDRAAVAAAIAALPVAATPGRLRLKLSARGAFALQLGALPAPWPDPVPVALVPLSTAPGDWRLAHKTSDRAPYEAALAVARALGAAEALLVRTDGLVTEGATTSLFVDRKGTLLTPPVALGLLPGVLRQSLLEQGRAREAPLTAADVATASADSRLFIGNALRGLAPAQLLQLSA